MSCGHLIVTKQLLSVPLKVAHGVPDTTALHGGPFSYKAYLSKLLEKTFWGDEVVLWSISMMCGLKITIVNSRTLQEYQICHDMAMRHVDIGLVYNASAHYSVAGKSSAWSLIISSYCNSMVACSVAVDPPVQLNWGYMYIFCCVHQATWSLALYCV